MNLYKYEIKPKAKIHFRIAGYQKVHASGNENCLFSSLDMLVFDGSFGSYILRQLVADHFNNKKDVYIDHNWRRFK